MSQVSQVRRRDLSDRLKLLRERFVWSQRALTDGRFKGSLAGGGEVVRGKGVEESRDGAAASGAD